MDELANSTEGAFDKARYSLPCPLPYAFPVTGENTHDDIYYTTDELNHRSYDVEDHTYNSPHYPGGNVKSCANSKTYVIDNASYPLCPAYSFSS